MKEIYNVQTINEFKTRIQKLNKDSQAQWGKMNVYQMVKHCADNEKMMLGENELKSVFIGRLFGKLSLKANIKNDEPLKYNSPTHPDLVITGNGDVEEQKAIWMNLLDKYPQKSKADFDDFMHPFYRKMNNEQVSRWVYKHIDHHLRQFGV